MIGPSGSSASACAGAGVAASRAGRRAIGLSGSSASGSAGGHDAASGNGVAMTCLPLMVSMMSMSSSQDRAAARVVTGLESSRPVSQPAPLSGPRWCTTDHANRRDSDHTSERHDMKIVVIGGSGLIGSKLVTKLHEHGHQTVAASPNTGVNTLTGEGLADAVAGASVVV